MGFRVRTPASEVLCKGEPRAVPCLPGLLLSALLAHPSPQKLSRPDSRLRWLDSALWSSCAGKPEVNCSKQAWLLKNSNFPKTSSNVEIENVCPNRENRS